MFTPSTELAELMVSTQRRPQWVDLYTITLANGTVLRWHDSDREIVSFDGTDWLLGPGIKRSQLEWGLSLKVSECDITLHPRTGGTFADVQVGGTSLLAAVTRGEFDGADVRIERGFKDGARGEIVGTKVYFRGKVGDFGGDDLSLLLVVRSPLDLLDAPFPAGVYQPSCPNRLFDSTCGLNAAAWVETGEVLSSIAENRTSFVSDRFSVQVNRLDWFRLGRVQFITGANSGRSMTVKDYAGPTGLFSFARPWPAPIAVGDTFRCWPGCNKTIAMCSGRYNNRHRFRGQPAIPDASTTL